MTAVFLDTVGLLAVWDVADQWHALADPVFERLQQAGDEPGNEHRLYARSIRRYLLPNSLLGR